MVMLPRSLFGSGWARVVVAAHLAGDVAEAGRGEPWGALGEDGHVADAGQSGGDSVASDVGRDSSQLSSRLFGRCCLREVCGSHGLSSGRVARGMRFLSG